MATELAEKKTGNGAMTIKQRLCDPAMIAELGKAMPAHCKPERMARVAITALTRTPKLSDCTQASFFKCLLDLSAWGLEPDGRHAHLIPYGTECTLVLDYKGLVQLAYRSGCVNAIHADVVRRGDLFDYSSGYIRNHVPWFLRDPADRPKVAGEVYAAYCICQLKDNTAKHEIMSVDEIEGIRKRSKAGTKGPWVTDWNEMAKKTVFRRLSKWLPLSAEIIEAFHGDDDGLASIQGHQTKRIAVSDVSGIFHQPEAEPLAIDVVASEPEATSEPVEGVAVAEPTIQPDSPRDAVDPLEIYRQKIRAEFGMIQGAARLRSRYDQLCGPEGNATADESAIITSEYELRRDAMAAKK